MENEVEKVNENEILDKKILLIPLFFLVLILISLVFLLGSKIKKGKDSFVGKIKGEGFYKLDKPQQITPNTPFKVRFIANSDNKQVNAVALNVEFDPNKLTIASLDTSKSFCQFYPENKFDNSQGFIRIQCGAPNPGFKGESDIAIVTFIAKSVGETFLDVNEESQILLNDGKGTDIFTKPIRESIIILNSI